MKKKSLFCLSFVGLCLAGLSACSGGSQYYEIKFYTDYEGISTEAPGGDYLQANLDVSRAVYVGSGFVPRNGSNRVARLSRLAKDGEGKAISYQETRQNKQEGCLYTFDGWQGFYDSNAFSGGSAPENLQVDLKNIQADCAVFAHFSVEKEKYSVTIQDADSSLIYQGLVEYGTRLGEALSLAFETEEAAKKKLEGVVYPLPSFYYEEHSFTGQYEDANGTRFDVDSLLASEIKKQETYKPIYNAASYKDYTVSFFSDNSFSSPLSVNGSDSMTVQYGSPISGDFSSLGDATHDFLKWEGIYGEDAPESVKGRSVDPDHILYNCSVYPVLQDKKQSVAVNFYNADGTVNKTFEVEKGVLFADISAPSNVDGVPSGEIFSSVWAKGSIDGEFAKEDDAITAPMDYYPVTAVSSVSVTGAKGDRFIYDFEVSKKGYVLSSFAPSASRSDKKLIESDLGLSALSKFTLVGIKKLSSSGNAYRTALESASFPASVKYVSSKAFSYHSALSSISLPGLEEAEAFGFSEVYALSSIELPSSLKKAGSKLFYADSNLSSIRLHMTEKEAKSRDFASDWNSNGDALISVNYDSAE